MYYGTSTYLKFMVNVDYEKTMDEYDIYLQSDIANIIREYYYFYLH